MSDELATRRRARTAHLDAYRHAMRLAITASDGSPDPHVRVGAVVLRQDRTVAGVGFNDIPGGTRTDWADRDERRALVVHAEVMALRHVTPLEVDGGYVVCTLHPCAPCLATVAAYGIHGVIYAGLPDPETYDPEHLRRVAGRLGIVTFHLPEEDL